MGETQKHAQILEPRTQRNDDPLTLSQLSPRKLTEQGSPPNQPDDVPVPVSPMHPSKKRASTATEASDDILRNGSQKERIVDSNRAAGSSSGATMLQPSRRKNGVASTSAPFLGQRLKAKAAPLNGSPPKATKGKAGARAVVSSRPLLGHSLNSAKVEKPRSAAVRNLNASHPIRKLGQISSFDKSVSDGTCPRTIFPNHRNSIIFLRYRVQRFHRFTSPRPRPRSGSDLN